MNLESVIDALGATAADLVSLANVLERALEPPSDPIDPCEADQLAWAEEARFSAGSCIAAINHLNGVSPE